MIYILYKKKYEQILEKRELIMKLRDCGVREKKKDKERIKRERNEKVAFSLVSRVVVLFSTRSISALPQRACAFSGSLFMAPMNPLDEKRTKAYVQSLLHPA